MSAVNQSAADITGLTDLISSYERQIFTIVIDVFLCGLVGLLGAVGNVINLVVFYKQGLDTTINISFFAMAISDLCSLIFQMWYLICVIPYFESLDIPMIYSDVQYLIGGVPREVFARVTCLITAYITAERCFCIAFPLKIKQIITPNRTTTIIICIYAVIWTYAMPLFFIAYLEWKFYPENNRTLLAAAATSNKDIVEGIIYIIHAFFGVISLIAVVLFTSILIRKLGEKSAWRQTVNADRDKSETMSKRDRSTMTMVVLIASILIISYIPAVLLSVTTFCQPEFSTAGQYSNMFKILWSVALLFETLNSTVNIFLYFEMSSKYRQIFWDIFTICNSLQKKCAAEA